MSLRVGQIVEVRSKQEILATLDNGGQLDGLPFMPQMFSYCGKRFRVFKSAHKTCDTVFPVRGRKMADSVHLNIRCDGDAYGGCQAGCLIFWKEAWLKPVTERSQELSNPGPDRCTEKDVWNGTQNPEFSEQNSKAYVCQATRLPYYTTALQWWDLRQYVKDFTSGNVGLWRLLQGFIYSLYYHLSQAGIGLGPMMRWVYNKFHYLWQGTEWPRATGNIRPGQPTPKLAEPLNLQPGELVRVKRHADILKTLTIENKNQGLYFDAEMVPFCGKTFRVLKRVTRILDEKTGKMLEMKNPCIILDGVVCESRYSDCRLFCPRAIYSYWREIWLERVVEPQSKEPSIVQASKDSISPACVASR